MLIFSFFVSHTIAIFRVVFYNKIIYTYKFQIFFSFWRKMRKFAKITLNENLYMVNETEREG